MTNFLEHDRLVMSVKGKHVFKGGALAPPLLVIAGLATTSFVHFFPFVYYSRRFECVNAVFISQGWLLNFDYKVSLCRTSQRIARAFRLEAQDDLLVHEHRELKDVDLLAHGADDFVNFIAAKRDEVARVQYYFSDYVTLGVLDYDLKREVVISAISERERDREERKMLKHQIFQNHPVV